MLMSEVEVDPEAETSPHRKTLGGPGLLLLLGLIAGALVPLLPWPCEAGAIEDGCIAGYAAAALEQEFGLPSASITIRDGSLTVTTGSEPNVDRDKIRAALEHIPGAVGGRSAQRTERRAGRCRAGEGAPCAGFRCRTACDRLQ